MANLPQQGQPSPDLDLTAEDGEHLGTAELRGQKTVLYFYPKDGTRGCTKEACAFRDRMDDYAESDIRVLASPSIPPSHTASSGPSTTELPSPHRRAVGPPRLWGCCARTAERRTA